MKATIITDASVNTISKNCGGAFYIGCKLGKFQKAMQLKVKTNSSNVAELHTLTNAIYTLSRSSWQGITEVEVYSDSLAVIESITGRKLHRHISTKILAEIKFLELEFCFRQGLDIRNVRKVFKYKHVKAHTGNEDKHSVINRWCDLEAKKCMRAQNK